MSVSGKLQIRSGQSVVVLGLPSGIDLELPDDATAAHDTATAEVVIVFVRNREELAQREAPLVTAARRDALTWVAYPKAGKLDTDLNRDSLWQLLADEDVRPVRQVAIDDTWSALRFRPA